MKVCLFDIDGTLIRSGGAGKRAFELALRREFGVDMNDQQVPFSGRTDRAIVRDFFDRHEIDCTQENWQRFKAAYLSELPGTLAALEGAVLPGIKTLLDTLAGRDDVAVGLLTGNVSDGAQLKLRHYEIADYFQFGGFGDNHFERDDVAHDAVKAARQMLTTSFDAGHLWVIGDTPMDIRCARAIDARVVAVCTGIHEAAELKAAEPDLLMDDLSEPATMMDALFG